MTHAANDSILTANGEFTLYPETPGKNARVEWCITGGTATVTPGYVNLNGEFSPCRGLDAVQPLFGPEGGVCDIGIPSSGLAALKVEDAAPSGEEDEIPFSMIVCQTRIPI